MLIRTVFVVLSLAHCNFLLAAEPLIDASKAWFRPFLEQNDDPACPFVLEDATRYFWGIWPWPTPYVEEGLNAADGGFFVKGFRRLQPLPLPELGWNRHDRVWKSETKASTLYLRKVTGGSRANDGVAYLQVSTTPFSESDLMQTPENLFAPTEDGFFFAYQDESGPLLVALDRDAEFSEVHRIGADLSTKRVCRVRLQPREFPKMVSLVKTHLEALWHSADIVSGKGMRCQSSWTPDRNASHQNQNTVATIVYRPWLFPLTGTTIKPSSASGDSFSGRWRLTENLSNWALHGVSARLAVARYRKQYHTSHQELTRWLEESKLASPEKADGIAHELLELATPFDSEESHPPEDERRLRQLIAEKASVEEISRVSLDNIPRSPRPVDRDDHIGMELPYYRESLLNLAVLHPPALEYLLGAGFDVSATNDFGRTALMSAVQADEQDSVKILLRHGAYLNARTFQSFGECSGDLPPGATALHYAVRYASPKMVSLLLENGIATHPHAELGDGRKLTAKDWLTTFPPEFRSDSFKVLDQFQVESLASQLTSTPVELHQNIAHKKLSAARQAYAKKDLRLASNLLQDALLFDSNSEPARADLALLDLRTGNLGRSLAMSFELIKKSADPAVRANAWFNVGLACELRQRSPRPLPQDSWGGREHQCSSFEFKTFLNAFDEKPSVARQNKLISLMSDDLFQTCPWVYKGAETKILRHGWSIVENGEYVTVTYIYLLHPVRTIPEIGDFQWLVERYGSATRAPTKLYKHYVFGDQMLTVFEGRGALDIPASAGVKCKW